LANSLAGRAFSHAITSLKPLTGRTVAFDSATGFSFRIAQNNRAAAARRARADKTTIAYDASGFWWLATRGGKCAFVHQEASDEHRDC
jgi:hypothetical protein